MTEWKTVKVNNEGTRYMISSDGVLINTTRKGVIKGTTIPAGYTHVSLRHGKGEVKFSQIHLLVAEHFLTKPEDGLYWVVRHKDKDLSNNRADNLEYSTQTHVLKDTSSSMGKRKNESIDYLDFIKRTLGDNTLKDSTLLGEDTFIS
ncbi:TPA: HNH endonuclease [Vibrio cholerae]|nr:HNH endonuclease [Vibrio cholerae]